MLRYVLKRLLLGVPIVLGVTLVTFLLFHVFGGDPVATFLGKNANAADLSAFRHEYGLDRSLASQYFHYLFDILTFDFGRSFVTRQPVTEVLGKALGPTLSLTVPSIAIITILAVCIGLVAARFRGRAVDRGLVVMAVLGMSVSYVVYILLGQYFLAFRWPLFQIHGYESDWTARWSYLALPILIMVVVGTGYDARYYRAVMVEEVTRDYVTTARAKGLSEGRILFRHVLPNAMVPVITRVMMSVPFFVTGAILLESFFGIPGLGSTMLDAIDHADFPVIKALTLLTSIVFVLSNVTTDVLYAIFDPRGEVVLKAILKDRIALFALVIIAAYVLVALLVGVKLLAADPEIRVGAKFLEPGAGHWLGTDRQGRDVLVRTLYGAKIALQVGSVTALISVAIGTALGALAGWFHGKVDAAIVWLYSTVQSIPSILLLIALAYLAGRGLSGVLVAFCATYWVGPCRVIRGEVLKIRDAEYVQAARVLGYGSWRILSRHVLPNTAHLVLVNFALIFVTAIKSEVIISYLGLGIQGEPSWGVMIQQARGELINGFYWQIGAASAAMFILVLSFNVFADALQDALDPQGWR